MTDLFPKLSWDGTAQLHFSPNHNGQGPKMALTFSGT